MSDVLKHQGHRRALALAGFAAVLTGCMAADPMPSPGRPDRDRILVSTTEIENVSGRLDVVGIIGLTRAAQGSGLVEIRQPFSETITIARTAADGTFAAVLAGLAGDRLVLTFRETDDGPASASVDLDIGRYDAAGGSPATPESDARLLPNADAFVKALAPAVSAPDGRGRSTVQGVNLTPGDIVAVGNARSGEVVEATVSEVGAFEVTVEAVQGDRIVVIVRTGATGFTSQLVTLSVPAP